jgi:uncharacterized delta-60 repeat protein
MAARRLLRTTIGLAAFLSLPLVARAAGGIDPTFGSRGIVRTQLGRDSIAWAVRVQPDGKPVIGGFGSVVASGVLGHAWTVARYTQAGALDTSFDGDGLAVTSFSSRPVPSDSVQDVAIQPDSKIVAAGTAVIGNAEHFALARYTADGSLDPSFGSSGRVVTDFGNVADPTDDRVTSMALAGSKIVVAGSTHPAGNLSKRDLALARYNRDGSLDGSFGDGGKVVTDLGADDDANDVAIYGAGMVVAAGVSGEIVASEPHVAVVRYNVDGTLDPTFGRGGKLILGTGVASAVQVQPDGKLLLAGGRQRTELIPSRAFLVRLAPGGMVDKSYGVGGSVEQADVSFSALALDSRAGTLAVGSAGANGDFMVAAYTKAGVLVRELEPNLEPSSAALDVSVAPDGKIVVAGTETHEGARYTIALARYLAIECVVPRLVGKSFTAARLAVVRGSCTLGAVRRMYSRKVASGHVIAQVPPAGTRLAAGSRVDVTVSRGRRR